MLHSAYPAFGKALLRQFFSLFCMLVLLCSLCLAASCAEAPKLQKFQTSFMDVFDTHTAITGYAEDQATFDSTVQQLHDELLAYHQLFDIYHEYEGIVNLKTVNDHPGEVLTVDARIMELLLFAREIAARTGGKTDVTFGSVLKLWHNAREAAIADPEHAFLPDEAALQEAALHTGFDKLLLDAENNTLQILDAQLSLDVGAFAKGYAVQQVCKELPSGYLVSVGGNVYVSGPKADGKNSLWRVGVQNPNDTSSYLDIISVSSGTLVTSGDYQRYFTLNGVNYHHIIDPETLYPARYWRGVTVLCQDSGLADALSTSLFLMDQAEGQALLNDYGAQAVWISLEGECLYSEGYTGELIK